MTTVTPCRDGNLRPGGVPAVRCAVEGCPGEVLRHSLGCGMSDYRCTRCFTRYARTERESPRAEAPHALKRFLNELVAWREDG